MTSYVTRLEGPAPERDVARDLVKKGIIAAPVLVAASWAIWGAAGAASTVYAIAIVCVNFLLAAALITWTARISLGLIFLAVMLVRDAFWVSLVPLGLTIIITHLGLLVWELQYVSLSLAFPGLKPSSK